MTDFDDGGMDLPDDDLTDGPDLSDLEAGDDEALELDLDAGDEPEGPPSRSARTYAASGPAAAAAPRKPAVARTIAPARSGGRKVATKAAKKAAKKAAPARKTAPARKAAAVPKKRGAVKTAAKRSAAKKGAARKSAARKTAKKAVKKAAKPAGRKGAAKKKR